MFVPLVGWSDEKTKQKNKVRTNEFKETILFLLDGYLRKMNVNEVREMRMN